MGVCCYDCDKKHNRHDIIFPQTTCRLLGGLKLGSGLLLIVSFKSEKKRKIRILEHCVTERQTDDQMTCSRNTALCTIVHRAVKITALISGRI